MQIKDLSSHAFISEYKVNLKPLKEKMDKVIFFNLPDKGYIVSKWSKGLWVKEELTDERIYPFCKAFTVNDILDLEILND